MDWYPEGSFQYLMGCDIVFALLILQQKHHGAFHTVASVVCVCMDLYWTLCAPSLSVHFGELDLQRESARADLSSTNFSPLPTPLPTSHLQSTLPRAWSNTLVSVGVLVFRATVVFTSNLAP